MYISPLKFSGQKDEGHLPFEKCSSILWKDLALILIPRTRLKVPLWDEGPPKKAPLAQLVRLSAPGGHLCDHPSNDIAGKGCVMQCCGVWG